MYFVMELSPLFTMSYKVMEIVMEKVMELSCLIATTYANYGNYGDY